MDVQIRGHIPCPAPVASAFQVNHVEKKKKKKKRGKKNALNNNNYNNKNILVMSCVHPRKFLLIFLGEG